jgi:hypothetical protein
MKSSQNANYKNFGVYCMGFNMFLNGANDNWESRYYTLHVKYTTYIFLLKRNGETLG